MEDATPAQPLNPEPTPFDSRFTRVSHGILAIGVFGAFVFTNRWALAACALVIGLNVVGGTRFGPLNLLATRFLKPQPSPEVTDSADAEIGARFAEAVATALLATATALVWNHTPFIGWALAILVGVAAVITATTQICPGYLAYKFLFQRGHS